MTHISIRFLMGLHTHGDKSADGVERRRERAIDVLSHAYAFGSFFDGRGLWQRTHEPSLMFETIQEDLPETRGAALGIAAYLREALGQQAIGLSITETSFTLVKA